jgi:hypothetical protein
MSADQAARQAADNRKMHLETLRQQSLMYPTSAILTVWREGIEAALADVARLTRERDRLRAALDRVRDVLEANPCEVIHCDRPRGWSCYDSLTEARSGRGKYTDEFRARLAAGAHLCFSCQLRASMLAPPSDGAAGGGRG